MEDYLLFLDEADVTPNNPFFCLAGIIIKRSIYENELIKKINALKVKHFTNTSTIFHYTEMKKNKDPFTILQDGPTRNLFWADFNDTIKDIDFTTIGTYLHMKEFKEAYSPCKNKHYEIAFSNLVDNYITFLKNNKSMGNIIFESRQWKENASIQEKFHDILKNGTVLYSADECQKYLSTIGFIVKKDNCIGLQLADFVPDSFMRNVNDSKNFYNVSNNFMNKLFKINGNYSDILGLKRIL